MTVPSQRTKGVFAKCNWATLCRHDVLWATYYAARQLLDQDIEGDFVECGVFAGTHPAMMACAILDDAEKIRRRFIRRVHLFDSFNGIPEQSEQDQFTEDSVEKLRKGTTCPLDIVKEYMAQWGIPDSLLVYHVGLFDEVMPVTERFPIALLRIDCDLYSSVRTVFQCIYPWLTERGICIMDDYAFPGARLAFFESIMPGTISPISWQRR